MSDSREYAINDGLALKIEALRYDGGGFEQWNAACAGIAKLLRTGWPFLGDDPAKHAPSESAEYRRGMLAAADAVKERALKFRYGPNIETASILETAIREAAEKGE